MTFTPERMKVMPESRGKENGSLIVEATFVFPIMFVVIFFLIFVGNAYYQMSRVEAIATSAAIEGAAQCADPVLSYIEDGEFPDINSNYIKPYRFIGSTNSDVEGTKASIQAAVSEKLSGLKGGLFSGMELQETLIVPCYDNYFVCAMFEIDINYSIRMPIRLLFTSENMKLNYACHLRVPSNDTSELIRTTSFVGDYLERVGVIDAIEKGKSNLIGYIQKAKNWANGNYEE